MLRQQRNVILITADAWRADFVDEYAGVPLLPALDPVRDRLCRFDACYANAPWTSPALVSAFTGEDPLQHGVHFEWSAPRSGTAAVGALLAEAGWSVPTLSYLARLDNYRHLGFDEPAPMDADPERLLAAIRATPEPFFLWFHYKHTHLPYWAAAEYRALLGVPDPDELPARLRESVCTGFVVPRHRFRLEPEDTDLVRRLYAAGVREMSDWLARVLGAVDDRHLAERTSLVLTADHAEELLDHGHVGHASTAHHGTLHEEVLRIPLLVLDPRVDRGARILTRVQGLDLFPTLLSLAGHPAPPSGGADLTPAILNGPGRLPEGRTFVFHSARMGCPTPRERAHQHVVGASDGDTKAIFERYDTPRDVLYDLGSDPAEQAPLANDPRLDAYRAGLGLGLGT